MATFNKINTFIEYAVEGANLGSDTFKVALTNTAHSGSFATLSDLTLASGAPANLDSVTLVTTSSAQSGGTYKLVIQDKTMTASGTVGPFQYVYIYDDTVTGDPLVCYFDNVSTITLASGDTFTLNFDETNGLLQIA
jgi:hypothetical protein